jgi:hypothetical protein
LSEHTLGSRSSCRPLVEVGLDQQTWQAGEHRAHRGSHRRHPGIACPFPRPMWPGWVEVRPGSPPGPTSVRQGQHPKPWCVPRPSPNSRTTCRDSRVWLGREPLLGRPWYAGTVSVYPLPFALDVLPRFERLAVPLIISLPPSELVHERDSSADICHHSTCRVEGVLAR